VRTIWCFSVGISLHLRPHSHKNGDLRGKHGTSAVGTADSILEQLLQRDHAHRHGILRVLECHFSKHQYAGLIHFSAISNADVLMGFTLHLEHPQSALHIVMSRVFMLIMLSPRDG